jgi:GntR family transcriptional regulator
VMEFNQPKGIYQQIAEQVRDRIAGGEWPAGDRIPSVREMAVNLGVNPNTVTRSYQTLLDNGIIDNRRGIGYFVADTAREKIMDEMKNEFIGDELPRLFRLMKKLGIDVKELVTLYEGYNQEVSA